MTGPNWHPFDSVYEQFVGPFKGNNRFYITTAIDYPNARPHIGTAFEKIGADIQARFRRFCGQNVYFLMGNDENTAKVLQVVNKQIAPVNGFDGPLPLAEWVGTPTDGFAIGYETPEKATVQQYVDKMAAEFKLVWRELGISNNDFIQTSEERHRIGVQKFIQTVYDAGYIYKKPYKGLYCTGCEEFKLAKNLVGGKCQNHTHLDIVEKEEENYWFKQSAFKQWILDLYIPAFNSAHIEILPESRHNEMKAFVEAELEDISISRNNQGWGIPVPWDESQVVYVWFDALLNYLTAIGFGTDEAKFDKWWPADIHVIGKDITRFHCALWPAMIAAYNEKAEKKIAYPDKVYAHGFIYRKKDDELVKESKSNAGAVTPLELSILFGGDAVRYYFMSKCPFGGDGEYSLDHFQEVYNADLANNLGNLVSRVANMSKQYFDGIFTPSEVPKVVWHSLEDVKNWVVNTYQFRYREALEIVWAVLRRANEYIEQQKPWSLIKEGKHAVASGVLNNVAAGLRLSAIMLLPYLPLASRRVLQDFSFPEPDQNPFESDLEYLLRLGADNYAGFDEEFKLQPFEGKYPALFPRKDVFK